MWDERRVKKKREFGEKGRGFPLFCGVFESAGTEGPGRELSTPRMLKGFIQERQEKVEVGDLSREISKGASSSVVVSCSLEVHIIIQHSKMEITTIYMSHVVKTFYSLGGPLKEQQSLVFSFFLACQAIQLPVTLAVGTHDFLFSQVYFQLSFLEHPSFYWKHKNKVCPLWKK